MLISYQLLLHTQYLGIEERVCLILNEVSTQLDI